MKRSVVVCLSAAVFASLLTASASAALVIDQQQSEYSGSCYSLQSGTKWGQSFKPGHDNLAGAGIRLQTTSALPQNGAVTIELWDALPTGTTGTPLRSVTDNVSVTDDEPTWLEVSWDPWDVPTDTTTLFLGFRSDNTSIGVSYAKKDAYADGTLYRWTGSVWGADPSSYDFAFHTYYYEADPVAAPVPGAVLLGTVGLGTAGYLTRRRVA